MSEARHFGPSPIYPLTPQPWVLIGNLKELSDKLPCFIGRLRTIKGDRASNNNFYLNKETND
jgi:hypothetical protein